MKCEALFKKIDELNDKYVKVWEDVCNIESPTEYKEGVDACGKYLVELAKKRNWKIKQKRKLMQNWKIRQ